MGRKPEKEVVRWLTLEELNEEIRKRKICSEVLRKLFFIKELYKGATVPQAAKEVGVSKVIGYVWLERWNKQGLEGLKPNYGGGRPSELSDEQKEELKSILKERDNWTTKEVRELIKENFGVEYSLRHVSRLLKSFGMKYAKPYQKDYRRPENAEESLKKLEELEVDLESCIIGFLDETSPQLNANTQRLWSFNKPSVKKNTTKMRANTFGFYAINGESVVDFKENSKKESVCEFLEKIREKNPDKIIIIVLDNFRSHWARKTRRKAKKLNMVLVYLPPYSPDLNPIEQIWRVIKRVLSPLFIKTLEELKEVISNSFYQLTQRMSFEEKWIKKFLNFG
ncbi:IS630 family transposase [Archaeoglobus fulgidus]|nr:IS630 family transposase [Archaeoglobus fulgidus]